MSASITRRQFITGTVALPLIAALEGCGYPAHIDPQLFVRDVSLVQLVEEVRLHARDLPGGYGLSFKVLNTSHSMSPTIVGDDYLVVAGKENRLFESLKAGEIITYQADWLPVGASPVTHRLVKRENDGWILSGDANERSEPQWRVTEKTYIGAVVAIYRLKNKA